MIFEDLAIKAWDKISLNRHAADKPTEPTEQDKTALTEEIATPSLVGVRNPWMGSDSMAGSLSPARLASILQSANEGNDHDLLTLAGEMEERDPHYASVLSTRKLAVEGLPVTVEAASEDATDEAIAEAVRQLTRTPEFEEMTSDLLDGLGKGRSTVEMMWYKGEQFTPVEYIWRDPRYFRLHPEDPCELRLIDDADLTNGIELPQYKFITHIPKLRTGITSRAGIARLVVVSYMCKSFALADWMAFAELFGLPIRVGRYGQGAGEEDKKILKSAVASIGSDAAAIIPESMRIEFIERASTANGDQLFSRLADWLDKQVSKAVLGQTATTEGVAGSLGSNDEQADVRQDLIKADAKQLDRTQNRDLVKPFIDLNFGIQDHYPRIVRHVAEAEDMQLLINAVSSLVPLGFEVKQEEIRDKLNLTDPKEGDILFEAATVGRINEEPSGTTTEVNHQHSCPTCNPVALNRTSNSNDEIDDIADESLADWEKIVDPMINPVEALANEVQDMEELKARLPELLADGKMDATELIGHLAAQTMKAKGLGDG